MAARQTTAGDADRAFAASLVGYDPKFANAPNWADSYAARQANTARIDLARGDLPSVAAGRAHVLTPEHPERALRPKGEGSRRFAAAAGRSKYAERLTGLTERPPAESPREARRAAQLLGGSEGEAAPILHRRQLRPTIKPITFGIGADKGEIYVKNTEDEIVERLEYAARLGPHERVTISGYDCSRRDWQEAFTNPGHTPGINADALLEHWRESGESFEQFIMGALNDASYGARWRVTHICQWQITILPHETQAVRDLRRSLRR